MTLDPGWPPEGIDSGKANIARVYDYWLGGTNNFRADQDAARAIISVEPKVRAIARANRAFLGRAVRFLAGSGIRQFLDIGSGIPAHRNVHEVAQETDPGARVVYVDSDPVAVAHSQHLLRDDPGATAIQADLRYPEKILGAAETQLLINFEEPVGVLLLAVLHFISDADDPHGIVAAIRDALAPGSYLVVCHSCTEGREEMAEKLAAAYGRRVAGSRHARSRDEILRLFDGFELVEPGLVWIPQWRPDSPADVPDHPEKYWGLVGVGRLGGPSGSA